MKVNVTLDDDLMARIDDFANENYMSRSGLISLACSQYLNAQMVTLAIREMSLTMRKIADAGTIDAETKEQLEDFERLSKLLTGQLKV